MSIIAFDQRLSEWATKGFCSCFHIECSKVEVVPTTNDSFGDFQCNAAMAFAKELKRSPRDIAETFIEQVSLPDFVEKAEIAGPGFINLFIKDLAIAEHIQYLEKDEYFGIEQSGSGKTVVIDYSSPNIAKPMHIGHIRSTVIGNAIDRLYRQLGFNVISDNHLGDWGTQFGLMLVGYDAFVDEEALKKAPVDELERIYVASYHRSKKDPKWREKAKAALVKLQQGDASCRALWERFIELSIKEFNTVYERLDVRFNLYRGESFYNDSLPIIIQQLEEQNLATPSDGALIVDLEEEGMPVCIVKKSDGGYNYATTDLATVQSRQKEFNPDRIIYVTDERQQLHFRQFFCIADKLNMNANLVHVWFGLMRLPEATFSTREGNVIKLTALLDEAERRALDIIKKNNPARREEDQKDLAKAIGIGAVKYMDLSQNPQSLVTFTWEKALNMEGNSAPYLQYTYARISSVIDKYFDEVGDGLLEETPIKLEEPIERKIALKLSRFESAVTSAAMYYKPNILADYLYELSQLYSSFYQNVPFLKAEVGTRESRIQICRVTARIINRGLQLLGIETRERI